MKIIITGSLGHISKPLTEDLINKGHQITVISSKAEKKREIEALGATAAIGLLDDIEFLESEFNGADAVYAMVPPNYAATDLRAYYQKLGNNYAQAIRRSGVKRVVHLSSYGAHLDHGTGIILGAHDVEGILNELTNVAVTHLRPGYFYYNFYSFVDMIKQQGFIGSNYGEGDKLVMVDPTDIATAAAEELTKVTDAGSNVRYIASDDLTANEVAQILGEAVGKPDLKWLLFTDEQVKDNLAKAGLPPAFVAGLTELNASIHSGILREDYDKHRPTTMGKIKLKDFAKEFATAF